MTSAVSALRRNLGGQAGAQWAARLLFYSAALAVVTAFSFGGGASNVYLSNALVELSALPALILGLWALTDDGAPTAARPLLILLVAAILIVSLQLVPMPSSIWSVLPFHEKALMARAAVGGASTWAPLSLDPEATIVSLLTLTPPVAIFIATLSLTGRERRLLVAIALIFGFLNGFVGLLQLSQGVDSVFYLYGGDEGVTVGLFANRNHEAALLYSLVPFVAAWIAASIARSDRSDRRRSAESESLIRLLLPGTTLVVLIIALLMAQSRAGVILLLCALVSGVALQRSSAGARGTNGIVGVFGAVSLAAVMVGAYYGLYRTLSRFEGDVLQDARVKLAELTSLGAVKALPFGTGLGSFVPAYASIEKPSDIYIDRYANQAHNDYLQIALEMGLPGVALIVFFLLWLFMRFRQIWFRPSEAVSSEDILMMRAATISISLLLAHSLVDYPLRTEALMVFFAFCCALLAPPLRIEADAKPVEQSRREYSSRRSSRKISQKLFS